MYKTIEEIKAANLAIGQHWFSKDTMSYFKSKVYKKVYGGKYFVTSEVDFSGATRFYSVRACLEGKIETISEFLEYTSQNRAVEAIKILLVKEA